MKDIGVLLVLLSATAFLVGSLPYQADSSGKCLNATEYLVDDSNLCCKKCHRGQRLKIECSTTTETVCEPCPTGQYTEGKNYSPNCFSCKKCKSSKGLLYVQNCSTTTNSLCGCRPGMYCIMGFENPYCAECSKYTLCQAGYGVSASGTADSNVKCEPCPEGSFSDTASYTDRCRPHTSCQGRTVIRKGNTTSDTVCEPGGFTSNAQPATKEIYTKFGLTALSTTLISISDSKAAHKPEDSTLSISLVAAESVSNHSTKIPPPTTASVAVIASVSGVILVVITIILLYLRKTFWRKGAARLDHKVDANGNCETSDKINQDYLGDTQLMSITVTSPEQQCLLEKGENCSDQSQCSNNNEALTKTDGGSSNESIGPLQPISAHVSPQSVLSEPTTLLSNNEQLPLQSSIPTQSSSQPTSPQIISPTSTSPHVNVNITFHIGNGSSTTPTPSVIPTDILQMDPLLPLGEEEEAFSIPQQEAGKQSLLSVQESTGCCT
ncbi:tumor necrosis factor receptor superfamily member 1B isoform X2 [Antennarius striatus]|uniref:tumor necrosis factor receptor superfamily member 1B isoform X2 n=1 Tax=Antennarius striatus TaxID=241820 RepID=UPI0035AF430E